MSMLNGISALTTVSPTEALNSTNLRSNRVGQTDRSAWLQGSASTGEANFASVLQNALQEVEQAQKISDETTVGMLLGSMEIHQATIAMDKATLTLRTFVQVRDKMLEAYQEIMRMQV